MFLNHHFSSEIRLVLSVMLFNFVYCLLMRACTFALPIRPNNRDCANPILPRREAAAAGGNFFVTRIFASIVLIFRRRGFGFFTMIWLLVITIIAPNNFIVSVGDTSLSG